MTVLQAWLDAGEPPVYVGFGSMSGPGTERIDKLVIEPARMAFSEARRKYLKPYKGVAETLAALKAKNAEFPLGVDAMLVSADECVVCLPRTTRVTWATL